MIPPPSAVGLFLCRRVTFDPSTKAFGLTDAFWRMDLPTIPGPAAPFVAFAALRGSLGSGTVRVAAYRLDTHALVYTTRRPIAFADRLQTIYVPLQVDHLRVPVAGEYEFDLMVDFDIVAQQSVHFVGGASAP